MMFGDEVYMPIDLTVGAPPQQEEQYQCSVEYVEWIRNSLRRAHSVARQQLGVSSDHQKQYYDRKAKPRSYEVGKFVWFYYPPKAKRKLGVG